MPGLAQILKTGFELSNLGQRYGAYKEGQRANEDKRRNSDVEFAKLIQDKGGRFVHGDTVMDDETGTVRPVDKKRTVSHKTVDGEVLRFELPTPEEQANTALKRLHTQFAGEKDIRDATNQEAIDTAGKSETARLGARRTDRTAQLNDEGIDVPDALDTILPGLGKTADGKRRRVLPGELDNLITSTGSFSNMLTKNDPKPKEVQGTNFTTDKAGNVTQTITFKDGTTETKKLGAIGKPGKESGDGALTAYQQYEIGHTAQKERTAAANTQQGNLDKLHTEQQTLLAQNDQLMRSRSENKAKLGFVEVDDGKGGKKWAKSDEGDSELTASQRGQVSQQIAKDEAQIQRNMTRIQQLGEQKKSVDNVRRRILGEAPAQPALKQRTQGSLTLVTDPNGVEHAFPTPEAAQQFQAAVAQAQQGTAKK